MLGRSGKRHFGPESVTKAHRRRLPPLNPLRSFEAAARLGSFVRAADELAVTPGAISRSIRSLEAHLGFPLFVRAADGLELDEAGRQFAATLTDAFGRIGNAAERLVAARSRAVLTVRGYTSFVLWWLVPRLPAFRMAHPDIEVHLLAASDHARLDRGSADLRIRYGRGRWRDTDAVLLFREALVPVCSPSLLDPAARPYPLAVLDDQVLLHASYRRDDWADWLALHDPVAFAPRGTLQFDELSVLYEAAIAGHGIAIGQRAYLGKELAEGRLFAPFDTVLERDLGYYLTSHAGRPESPAAALFREWLVGTFAADDALLTAIR